MNDFIDQLASAAPTPGGGGASACVGALARALASMVGNLTVGKKTYAAVEDDVRASLDRLAALRARLLALVDEDARAFEPLAEAYRLPKATPEEQAAKNAALQQALVGACDVPLAIMRAVAEVVDETAYLAHQRQQDGALGRRRGRSVRPRGQRRRQPERLHQRRLDGRRRPCRTLPRRRRTHWRRARAHGATTCSAS